MKQVKRLNVAIVGGGPGCKAIMDMIFAASLSQLRIRLIGVASTNPKAVGYCYAQEKGIYTTRDYRDLYKLKDLHMLIELTGREEVANEISQTKPDHVRVMDHVAARLFWDVFQLEEEWIKQRRAAEEALRGSEEKYSTLVENSLTGIYIDQDGKIVFANKRFAEIYGYSGNELLGMESWRLVHPEDRDLTDEIRAKRLRGEEAPSQYEARGLTKNGETIWIVRRNTRIEYRGRPAILGNIADITERKRAEEALKESERRYKTQFEEALDAIFIADSETGILVDCNYAASELVGRPKSELIGKHQRCLHPPEEVEGEFSRTFKQHLREKEGHALEGQVITKNGEIKDVSIKANIFELKGKKVLQGIFRDVTERKYLQAQLQQAQKLEAIGTLAGGIAHDFNNLLMGIQGNVSLMLMGMDHAHPDYERLKSVEKQIQSGARLTSHLLGYARKGKYDVNPLHLNQLVEQTSDTFGRTKKAITIYRELAEELFPVEADQTQIEQVLLNLFVNAADAMPGGGDLVLKTMNVTHKDMMGKLYDPKPGNYVLLTVTDTGTGMYKKTMERIFDPFFTTKEREHGTGLGLASAYGIIKAHGGYIDVDSQRGHGTTFSIYLPASRKKVQKVVKAADGVLKGTETVLLVDDEEVILEVGQELLEAMGYRVLTARDGKEAIEVYRKNLDDIDFVLLDMVMPKMGGGEAYDRMKEINPDIKVLLSSGFSIDGEASEILQRGCNGFIQKPFTMKQLSGVIRKILEKP